MAEPDWGALEASIDGSVVLPRTPGYDDARRPAIVNFHDVCPRAVVRCRTPSDVAETLRFAARVGLPLAIRGGGHCFAGRSSTIGVVLDTTPMGSVTVSGDLATVGAGCRLGPLYDALAESVVPSRPAADPTWGSPGSPWAVGSGSSDARTV